MAIGKISFTLLIVSVFLMSETVWKITKIFNICEYLLSLPNDVVSKKKLLVIGVMSAQKNFKERESIRNTWGRLIENEIELRFLIGSRICSIPPADRITPYVCEKWTVNVPQGINLSTVDTKIKSVKLFEGHSGFSFIVKHNVSVVQLGVYSQIFRNLGIKKLRVFLFNAASGDKMSSVTFIAENYTYQDFKWKSIFPIKLSKDFEGELRLVTDKNLNITCESNIQNNGVIHIFEILRENSYVKFQKTTCMLVAFSYFLETKEALINFIKEKDIRKKNWEKSTEILKYQLDIESKAYNDILFLDLVDVYQNLYVKLFEFLKWTQKHAGLKYILKTDDDVFLDVRRIITILKMYSNSDWDWWSCFRPGCPPPKYGKWRDRLFPEKFYPPFPSGAGYIINNNIVSKIVSENYTENMTAGEDVALSIWIHKSLDRYPKKLNTTFGYWACGTVCSAVRPCNVPQLSWQQIYLTMQLLDSSPDIICPS